MRASIEVRRGSSCIQRLVAGSYGSVTAVIVPSHRPLQRVDGGASAPAAPQELTRADRLWQSFNAAVRRVLGSGIGSRPDVEASKRPELGIRAWRAQLIATVDASNVNEGWDIDKDEEWEMEVRIDAG